MYFKKIEKQRKHERCKMMNRTGKANTFYAYDHCKLFSFPASFTVFQSAFI